LTAAEDRRKALEILDAVMAAGARAQEVAVLLGVGLTTLQRWRRRFAGDEDGLDRRKGSQRLISLRLTDEERQRILLTCNGPEFAALPPGQFVPILADRGPYIGSERSLYRCSMPMARLIAVAVHGRSRSPARCHGWKPEGPTRCRAGTSLISPPVSVASGCTSIWWSMTGAARWWPGTWLSGRRPVSDDNLVEGSRLPVGADQQKAQAAADPPCR